MTIQEYALSLGIDINSDNSEENIKKLENSLKKLVNSLNDRYSLNIDTEVTDQNLDKILDKLSTFDTRIRTIVDNSKVLSRVIASVNIPDVGTYINSMDVSDSMARLTEEAIIPREIVSSAYNSDTLKEIQNNFNEIIKLQNKIATADVGSAKFDRYNEKIKESYQNIDKLSSGIIEATGDSEKLNQMWADFDQNLNKIQKDKIAELITKEEQKRIKDTTKEIQELVKQYDKYYSMLNKLQSSNDSTKSPLIETTQKEINEVISSLEKFGVTADNSTGKLSANLDDIRKSLNLTDESIKDIGNTIKKSNLSGEFSDAEKKVSEYKAEVSKAVEDIKELGEAQRKFKEYLDAGVDSDQLEELAQKIDRLQKSYDSLPPEIKENERVQKEWQKQLQQTDKFIIEHDNNLNRVGISYGNLGKRIRESLMNTFVYGAAYKVLNSLQDVLVKSVEKVKELDDAMRDIQVVTNQTDEQVRDTINSYSDMAYQLGVTTQEVVDGSLEWLNCRVI